MRRLLAIMLLTLIGGLPGAARAAKDELVIGITQFPSTFHPNIEFDGRQELHPGDGAAAVHHL